MVFEVWVDGIDMDVELVLATLGVEKCGDDFALVDDDAGVVFFEMLWAGDVPVFLKMVRRH